MCRHTYYIRDTIRGIHSHKGEIDLSISDTIPCDESKDQGKSWLGTWVKESRTQGIEEVVWVVAVSSRIRPKCTGTF